MSRKNYDYSRKNFELVVEILNSYSQQNTIYKALKIIDGLDINELEQALINHIVYP